MKCDRCASKAAYSRRYSGQSLCGACFSDSIVRKTARTISKYAMIGRGDDVVVAVSGGKDSLSLLHVMKILSRNGGFSVRALSIDEGIPGYRDEALDIVEKYCGSLDVPYDILGYRELYGTTLEGALQNRNGSLSSCSLCGTLRRRAMDTGAVGADVLATAHNMDDVLQTFLINLFCGDTGKIGWMSPASGVKPKRIKPFGEIYESEIVFYAFVNDIPFQTEPCPHMDEGIRTPIRQFLNSMEENHAGLKNSMYRAIQRISDSIPQTRTSMVCSRCGSMCTGDICSVCGMLERVAGAAGAPSPRA